MAPDGGHRYLLIEVARENSTQARPVLESEDTVQPRQPHVSVYDENTGTGLSEADSYIRRRCRFPFRGHARRNEKRLGSVACSRQKNGRAQMAVGLGE